MNDTELKVTDEKAETGWHRFWRLILAPPLPPDEMTPAQRRYDSFSAFPMFLAAILWMLSAFFSWVPSIHAAYGHTGLILSLATWCVFLLDMVIRFVLDPRKSDFFKRNWPLLIALLFPPLRVLLVASAVVRIKRDRNALAKMVGLYAVYAVAFVVVFGAALTLSFEIDSPGSTIHSYGDAVWWGFETVTTVGYGDFTPITVAGRVVAVLIRFTGAGAVGAVTAVVASRFVNNAASSSAQSTSSASSPSPEAVPAVATVAPSVGSASVDDLSRQMAALQAQIEQIANTLGISGANAAPDAG